MGTINAVSKQSPCKFEDDELDWLIGEIEQAICEATNRGLLLYQYAPGLVSAALDFFHRYHRRLDLGQARVNFESVRRAYVWNDSGEG